MNEQANMQLVEQAYQHVGAGKVESLLNILATDVQWELPEMPNVPFAGSWKGREQVRQFFNRMADVQDIVEFQPREFIAQGDKVVVFGRFTMHVKATGRASRSEWAHVWTFKDGSVTHMREYVDTLAVSQAHALSHADSQTR
jgi:ketosteroid isomerase-like protein